MAKGASSRAEPAASAALILIGPRLVVRRHVDFARVSSALCC